MKQYFVLKDDSPVYLYGASSIGKIVYEKNRSLNIQGFIDMRAEEIKEFMGLPVYTLPQISTLIKSKEDIVIMISVKNVFELEDIAYKLFEAGFLNLIYKSKSVLEGRGSVEDIRKSEIWDCMVAGNYEIHGEIIKCFENKIEYLFEDVSVISTEEGQVLAYLPVELIYTNIGDSRWSDLNIQGYYPHIYFFYYLSNHKNGQMEDYLKFTEETAILQGDIKITNAWRNNVLRNRTLVYEKMRFNLDVDPFFFHRNPPTAVWNAKGYFNLTSGKHRCAFLVSQGYRYIAIRVSKIDYEKYLSYEPVKQYRTSIVEQCRKYTDKKIYHPWFYRYPCSEPLYYSFFQVEALCRVIKLANTYSKKVKIYTNLSMENSLVRMLNACRMASVTDSIKESDVDIALIDWSVSGDVQAPVDATIYWYISKTSIEDCVAHYFVGEEMIYFCEETRRRELNDIY